MRSQSLWDHTVLPATRHKQTHPALTPAMQAGTRFTYPRGMEGWVDLADLIAPRPGVEPATFRSRVRRRTAAPCNTVSCSLPLWCDDVSITSFKSNLNEWTKSHAIMQSCHITHLAHKLNLQHKLSILLKHSDIINEETSLTLLCRSRLLQ